LLIKFKKKADFKNIWDGNIKKKRKRKSKKLNQMATHSALVSGVGRSPIVVSVRVDQ
jgi:hypothetical protein